MIDDADLALLLAYIERHWRQVAPRRLEGGVWIALHAQLEADEIAPITPVLRSWFLNERGLEERTLASFQAFADNREALEAQNDMPCCESHLATYPDGSLYLAFYNGALSGGAMSVTIAADQVVIQRRLWRA